MLCELLFNDKMFKEKQIEKYSNLMLRFTHENQKAQKYLLGGIEKTVEVHEAVLMPRVPHILKALYEEDILEEEENFWRDGGAQGKRVVCGLKNRSVILPEED